jgi:hypothetical protein
MWVVWGQVAGLNMAAHGSTLVTRPLTRSKPLGWFIQALAATTENAPATPAITIGTAVSMCAFGGSRSRSYR